MISSRLSLSMSSSLFQGMCISPSMTGSPFSQSNVVICSKNSSRKILIGIRCFAELDGLQISESRLGLDLIFYCIVGDLTDP